MHIQKNTNNTNNRIYSKKKLNKGAKNRKIVDSKANPGGLKIIFNTVGDGNCGPSSIFSEKPTNYFGPAQYFDLNANKKRNLLIKFLKKHKSTQELPEELAPLIKQVLTYHYYNKNSSFMVYLSKKMNKKLTQINKRISNDSNKIRTGKELIITEVIKGLLSGAINDNALNILINYIKNDNTKGGLEIKKKINDQKSLGPKQGLITLIKSTFLINNLYKILIKKINQEINNIPQIRNKISIYNILNGFLNGNINDSIANIIIASIKSDETAEGQKLKQAIEKQVQLDAFSHPKQELCSLVQNYYKVDLFLKLLSSKIGECSISIMEHLDKLPLNQQQKQEFKRLSTKPDSDKYFTEDANVFKRYVKFLKQEQNSYFLHAEELKVLTYLYNSNYENMNPEKKTIRIYFHSKNQKNEIVQEPRSFFGPDDAKRVVHILWEGAHFSRIDKPGFSGNLAPISYEILGHISTFLPVKEMIRFRLVSNEWNNAIKNWNYTMKNMLAHVPKHPVTCNVLSFKPNSQYLKWNPIVNSLVPGEGKDELINKYFEVLKLYWNKSEDTKSNTTLKSIFKLAISGYLFKVPKEIESDVCLNAKVKEQQKELVKFREKLEGFFEILRRIKKEKPSKIKKEILDIQKMIFPNNDDKHKKITINLQINPFNYFEKPYKRKGFIKNLAEDLIELKDKDLVNYLFPFYNDVVTLSPKLFIDNYKLFEDCENALSCVMKNVEAKNVLQTCLEKKPNFQLNKNVMGKVAFEARPNLLRKYFPKLPIDFFLYHLDRSAVPGFNKKEKIKNKRTNKVDLFEQNLLKHQKEVKKLYNDNSFLQNYKDRGQLFLALHHKNPKDYDLAFAAVMQKPDNILKLKGPLKKDVGLWKLAIQRNSNLILKISQRLLISNQQLLKMAIDNDILLIINKKIKKLLLNKKVKQNLSTYLKNKNKELKAILISFYTSNVICDYKNTDLYDVFLYFKDDNEFLIKAVNGNPGLFLMHLKAIEACFLTKTKKLIKHFLERLRAIDCKQNNNLRVKIQGLINNLEAEQNNSYINRYRGL
ncbi:F-box protein [Candidatus Margulisiibacteriota bacterium]